MLFRGRKYFKIGPYGLGAFAAILVAISIRVVLLSLGWPITNSDESTMGLMALHIAYRGEHPVFMYGQHYMGSLEPHISAALFFVFGPSFFALRFSLVILFALFLWVMYLLTCLLYTEKLALFVVVLLCFGSTETLMRQLKVVGGALETMLFGSLLLLLASKLALSFRQELATEERGRRFVLYSCFGLTAGLGLWSHMLVLPFLGSALVLLIVFCRSELRIRALLCLFTGFVVGFLPSLVFNITHPAQNSLGALWQLQTSGGTATSLPFSFWDQIRGTVLVSLPMATGWGSVCPVSASLGFWRFHISSCMLVQGLWGMSFLLLAMVATLLTTRELVRRYQVYKISKGVNEYWSIVRSAARLMLLISGGLTLLSYIFSPAPALVPFTSARYLVGLLVTLPALLAPLWGSAGLMQPASFLRRGAAVLKAAVLLFICIIYCIALVAVFQDVPNAQAINKQQYTMIDDLLRAHITHIYSDYYTCYRVIFQSNERIICGSLNEHLEPQDNRYPPYYTIVQRDPHAAYVFQVNSPQAIAFAQQATQSGRQYDRVEMDGYVIYRPG